MMNANNQNVHHPIRILNITPNGNIGGRERQLFLLAREFTRYSDIHFDTLFLRAEGQFYERASRLQSKTYTLSFRRFDLRRLVRMWLLFRSYDILNFWGVDNLCFVVALLTGKKMVFCLQGTRAILSKSITGLLGQLFKRHSKNTHKQATDDRIPNSPIDDAQSDGMPTGGHAKLGIKWSGAKRLINKQIFGFFLHQCDAIIVPSKYLWEFCRDYFNVPVNKILVVHNTFDPREIVLTKSKSEVRNEIGVYNEALLVGTAARFDPRKRLDRLVKAVSLVSSNLRVKAVIFGDGNSISKTSLLRQIEKLRVHANFLLPGFRSDIYNYINAIDLFVLPSDSEGMPLAIVESLYLKKPTVVFSDGGGVHEVILNGRTGYVVNSEQELADLIQRFYHEKEDLCRVAENGYRYVLDTFQVSRIALEYRRAFEAVAGFFASSKTLEPATPAHPKAAYTVE
ncbi:glycosyltransferase family 1 protein [candidate division KSB1 bacterium]|nr:MAG: glycosyltransferase family 1 protein [candidate division KSB1 bacterium]MBC6950509.1 glycosyltransferase family 1 protein [candidate division KSB1 bacterium]